jgi:hypothetical protein
MKIGFAAEQVAEQVQQNGITDLEQVLFREIERLRIQNEDPRTVALLKAVTASWQNGEPQTVEWDGGRAVATIVVSRSR